MVGSSRLIAKPSSPTLEVMSKRSVKMTSIRKSSLVISGFIFLSILSLTSSYRVYKVYKTSHQLPSSNYQQSNYQLSNYQSPNYHSSNHQSSNYHQSLPSHPNRSPYQSLPYSSATRNGYQQQSSLPIRSQPKFKSIYKKRSVVKNVSGIKPRRQYRLITILPKDNPINTPLINSPSVISSPSLINSPITAPTKLIILKDSKAIPFTTVDGAISTPEIESGSSNFEEGVGPAASFEPSSVGENQGVPSPSNSISSAPRFKKNRINKKKIGREGHLFSDESQGYATYVQPPVDFKPIIYANRRLDGVSSQRSLSGHSVPLPVQGPFPYGIPRGLSSWTLGGPRPFVSGNFWEALGSDSNLVNYNTNYPTNYNPGNYVYRINYPSNDQKLVSKKKTQKKYLYKSNGEGKKSSFAPWIVFPSSSFANDPKVTSFNNLPLLPISSSFFPSSLSPSSTTTGNKLRPITSSGVGSSTRRVTSDHHAVESQTSPVDAAKDTGAKEEKIAPRATTSGTGSSHPPVPKSPSPSSSSPSSSSPSSSSGTTAIRTKLPVGLTSWMFGGVRDLTGKHWEMPEMAVNENNPNVVPLGGEEVTPVGSYPSSDNDSPRSVPDFVDVPDPMMTSDGEYESVLPVVKELPKETEGESSSSSSGEGVRERENDESFVRKDDTVIYDDEPDSLFNSLRPT